MATRADAFVLLLPVKSPGTGKTRLTSLSDEQRGRLAAAFATDAADACLRTPEVARVLVISDDERFAATLAALGADVCPDPGGGLNAALRAGADVSHRQWPALQPVALCADLPAVRPEELDAALDLARIDGGRCFVRDADGTGTTLYTAPYDAFDPLFGPDSATAHLSAGATPLAGDLAGLRRDVDDATSLAEAVALGVGPATTAALATTTSP